MVGYVQLGSNVEDVRHPVRRGHVNQLRMRRKFGVTDWIVGHSDDLPCDGSHNMCGFRWASLAQRGRRMHYFLSDGEGTAVRVEEGNAGMFSRVGEQRDAK